MAFNGRAVRLGSTDRFGVGGPGGFPRAGTDLNGTPYVLLAGAIVEITDIPNGSGTTSVSLSGTSGNQIGGAFVWNNEIHFTLRGNTDALRKIDNLATGATSQVALLSEEIGACTTDGTTVWAYNTSNNTLYTLNPSTGALTEVGVVNFESGVTEGGIQGMLVRRGRHYIVGGHNDMMYELTDLSTNPSTITATRIDASITAFGANATGPAGAFVSGNESYLVDGARDALFRLLDPPVVQANIPRFVFNDGTVRSLDMTQYIEDLENLAWRSGYTPPSYASISGTAIDFDATSSVTQDTDLTLQLVASRGMDSVNVDMPIRVRDTSAQMLSIESIDEQFILLGTEDYELIIDITGNPDTVEASGHMEGFNSHWDAAMGRLYIRADEVTRLISGVHWDVDVRKGIERLMAEIGYNVVKPVPIYQVLPTLHLYRGVTTNFDIFIQNIPPIIVPNSRLIGVKSDLLAYGLNFRGIIPVDSEFTVNDGNVVLIIPSETGETADMRNYAYEIESGSPPAIGALEFTPKGNFGELTFDDVMHALGYEWTVDAVDVAEPTWNLFDNTREVINPDEVEVVPGNLQVTITFPNIAGATGYEYSLDSETHEREWTRFEGTLENNMITTIIPNLEDGVQYTLRLRVASPWIGSPISITVYGGRVCYSIQSNRSDRTQQYLYIFHTGHQHATQATRLKRLLLPTALTHPEGGLAVNANGDVFILHFVYGAGNEKSLYTFLAATIENASDGSRLTQDRKNLFPDEVINDGNILFYGMAEHRDNLYMYFGNTTRDWQGLQVLPVPTADGAVLTRTTTGQNRVSNFRNQGGLAATDEAIWHLFVSGSVVYPRSIDISDFSVIGNYVTTYNSDGTRTDNFFPCYGLKVIGNAFYSVAQVSSPRTNRLEVFRINPEVHPTRHILDFYLDLPIGLDQPRYLDILV